jgi:hypothetical protein
MSLEVWLIYLVAGRLLTWFLMVNGVTRPLWNFHPLLRELSQCDLCLGFWVYLLLALPLPQPFLIFPWGYEIFILAALTSFIAHLLRIGYQTKFGITVIE